MKDEETRLAIALAVLGCVESGAMASWNIDVEFERAYKLVKNGSAGCKLDLTITNSGAEKGSV